MPLTDLDPSAISAGLAREGGMHTICNGSVVAASPA
jgi:hypothetical protein